MKPLIIVMLVVQGTIFLVAAYAILFGSERPGKAGTMGPQIALPLAIVAGGSWTIADNRTGAVGTDIMLFGAALLLGMGIAIALMALRRKREAGVAGKA